MGVAYEVRMNHRRTKATDILSHGSVQVRGENIYYGAAGMAEHGPTVLFLHESGGTSATWEGQLTGLAQNARCLVPDLPGHGRSEGLGFVTVAGYRQAVLGFLDALAIRWPVVIAGVCLGAAVAIDLALAAPERIEGLVLSGVCSQGRAGAGTLQAVARGEGAESFVQGLFGERASSRLQSSRLQRWRNTSPAVRHGDLTAVSDYPLASLVETIVHPALLIAGECDPIATPGVAHRLATAMHNASAATVPLAGCLAMAEQCGAYNRLVSAFLSRLGAGSPVGDEPPVSGGYRRFQGAAH